jgi:drug/metabolite transporter (DMT)-like permease
VKLVDYVFVTYTSAAITLFLFSFITKVNLYPFATSELLLMFLHGIVCSGLGHSTYNWMLQHVSSTYVSTVTLGEPVFASLMVFVLLSEAPTFQTIMGGVVVIAGLYIFIKQK